MYTNRITVCEILNHPTDGAAVTVCGWARTVRASKAVGFLELNDGSCFTCLQIVFEADKLANYGEISALNVGSAVRVRGAVVCTPDARQPLELHAEEIAVEGASTPEYPLQKKRHSPEFLRTIPHLRPRTNLYSATFRIRSEAAFALHRFFHDRGFVYVHTPIISVSDCEGAGEMFRVVTQDDGKADGKDDGQTGGQEEFFGRPAYLTVSGQLQGEAMAMAFGRIYTFGPTFRAEKSYTQHHAAEFWMIEPEIAFADLTDDMALAEDMLHSVLRDVMQSCEPDLAFLNRFCDPGLLERLQHVAETPFAHVTYTDAIALLEKENDRFQYKVHWGSDLQTEHERYLTETVFRKPVFVTDYPKEIKAFYMRQNDDGRTVAAMDVLVPGIGEIIGGSQREERTDVLDARIRELGLDAEGYDWYLSLRRWGGTHHAGFGLGFERLIMYLTGIANIRDVLPFPRTAGTAIL